MGTETCPSNRKYGVEIECRTELGAEFLAQSISKETGIEVIPEIDDHSHESREYWKIVNDGSLHNQGWELVSPPLTGVEGFQQIHKICEALQELGCTINYKCGLHVHIDASDLTGADIGSIIRRYHINESVIDSHIPYRRREDNNRFCLGMNRIYNSIGFQDVAIRDFAEWKSMNITPEELIGRTKLSSDRREDRYYKVNLLSYLRHGTIEFRQHNGTVNSEKICNWIKFLLNFVETSKVIDKEFPITKIEYVMEEAINQIHNPNYLRQRAPEWILNNAENIEIAEKILAIIQLKRRGAGISMSNIKTALANVMNRNIPANIIQDLVNSFINDYELKIYREQNSYGTHLYFTVEMSEVANNLVPKFQNINERNLKYQNEPRYLEVKAMERVEKIIEIGKEMKKVFPSNLNRIFEGLDRRTANYFNERSIELTI